MFRLQNIYLYVHGNISSFQMVSGAALNFRKLYVIASGDINLFSFMGISTMDAGMKILAGGKITNNSIISMSGISSQTMMANGNIELGGMMSMTFAKRMHMLSGGDIEEKYMFSGSMFTTGTDGTCGGCVGTNIDVGSDEDGVWVPTGRYSQG
jgi:hypothetical protein